MKTVATHNGNFHPDDVFAVVCIMMLEGRENVQVVRTRDQSEIDACDWVVDVGFSYDPDTLRFDHHQPGAPVRENGLPYAAFGLVWKHYGEQLGGGVEVAEKIEENLVLPIDLNDNGIELYDVKEHGVRPVELYNVFESFKPVWQSVRSLDDQFHEAVDFAYDYLTRVIEHAKAKVAMKAYAEELYQAAEDKSIIVTDIRVSASLFIDYPEVVGVIYPDSNDSGNWMVSTVRKKKGSFENKKDLPEEWGGLRGEELERVSGIKGAVFCHRGLFLFGADSKEGAITAAEHLK